VLTKTNTPKTIHHTELDKKKLHKSFNKIKNKKYALILSVSVVYSYLRYKCKKLSFIARTGLKYDRGTREYFKECECSKGTFYTYVLQHFIYDHNLLLLVIVLFVIF
jgi:hypothetical protein